MISADSHIIEPPTLWADRLDRRFRERAPRILSNYSDRKGDWFICEDVSPRLIYAAFAAGVKNKDLLERSQRGFEFAPNSLESPSARLGEQDIDNVSAEVLYPTMADLVFGVKDRSLRLACFSVYNEYIAEYCMYAPDRLAGLAIIDLDDELAALSELDRCLRMGLRGVVIRSDPSTEYSYNRIELRRFWDAVVEANISVSIHRSAIRKDVSVDPAGALIDFTLIPQQAQRLLTEMLFSGLWERHRKLKVIFAEFDVGWIVPWLSRIDHAYERYGKTFNLRLAQTPSETVRDSVVFIFQQGFNEIDALYRALGVGSLMWGSDYPHAEATWPNSKIIADQFRNTWSENVYKRWFGINCAEIYQL